MRTGVLAAFDDDAAGRKAATRVYGMLRPFTPILRVPALAGRDPAQIFQEDGPLALQGTLTAGTVPLLGAIGDAEVGRWEHRLGETLEPLLAVRSAAAVLAGLLPSDAATRVREAVAGAELAALDDEMRAVLSRRCRLLAKLCGRHRQRSRSAGRSIWFPGDDTPSLGGRYWARTSDLPVVRGYSPRRYEPGVQGLSVF